MVSIRTVVSIACPDRAAAQTAGQDAVMPPERLRVHVPVSALTPGSGFHRFGYCDKNEFDPSDRYVPGMEAGFEGRFPAADDVR